MANSVNLANVNISLQQFQKMSSGTYNAGEVTLTSETTLGRLNNHVVFTGWNGKSISHTEVLALASRLIGLDANVKGDGLRNDPEFAELCAKPDLQLPAGEKAYIPATTGQVWNRDVFESVRLRQKHLLPQFETLCMDVVFETRGIYGDRGFPEGSHVFDSFGEQKFRDAFDFSGPNAPRVTAESLRAPLREAARMTACRRAEESAVKDAETGAITVTYSEPQGFPFHFHWTATVAIDGTTTTTPMVIERQ